MLLRVVLPRLLSGLLMVVLVSILVFVVLRQLPIDPVGMSLPPGATEADRLALTREFGLDRPVPEQYLRWASGLLHGEFGVSVNLRRQVGPLVGAVLPATLELVAVALVLGTMFGVGSGLVLFAVRNTMWEGAGDVVTSVLVSVPEFVWAIAGILLFGVWLHALPFIGRIDPDYAIPCRRTPGSCWWTRCWPDVSRRRSWMPLAHLALPAAALAHHARRRW